MKRFLVVICSFLCMSVFLFSCKTIGVLATVGGVLGEMAGIEGSVEMAESIVNSAESIEKATEKIDPEQEYYIGRAVAAQILSKYELANEPELEKYLNQICSALVLNSERPTLFRGYSVGIIDTEEINAFATSGGHILVSTGLIKCATSEDALAAVLAHEIAHIQLEHSLKAIKTSRVTDAITKTTFATMTVLSEGEFQEFSDVFGDVVDEIVAEMVDSGYSKSQEYEADETALEIMAATGYNPLAMNEMLKVLKINQKGKSGFSVTHPSPDERLKNLKDQYEHYDIEDTSAYRKERFAKVMKNF